MPLPISNSPLLILDTNVVLDWLLFADQHTAPLVAALMRDELSWVATAPMRDELDHVLTRGTLDRWQPDVAALWKTWDTYCTEVDVPPPRPSVSPLRCSDPDDQKFIDLSIACGAHWLLSRDRAVLRLARRLSDFGVAAITPAVWVTRNGKS